MAYADSIETSDYTREELAALFNNFAIGNLANVEGATWADGDMLIYNSSNSRFEPVNLLGFEDGWQDWTPSYSASGSMTFTSVTTYFARYKQFGKFVAFMIRATGTTGGSASTVLYATAPVTPAEDNIIASGGVRDSSSGSSAGEGMCFVRTSTGLQFNKVDVSNWGIGSGRIIHGAGVYEAA
jgi:hypothetical protein